MSDTCLIWSNEHSAWWGPDRADYTQQVHRAGKYTRAEALKICVNARDGWRIGKPPSEIPVRLDDVIVCVSSEISP